MTKIPETTEEQAPPARRLLTWIVAAPIVLVALLLAMHVFIRPIPPTQKAPSAHIGGPCWLCHMVTDKAAPVELEEQ